MCKSRRTSFTSTFLEQTACLGAGGLAGLRAEMRDGAAPEQKACGTAGSGLKETQALLHLLPLSLSPKPARAADSELPVPGGPGNPIVPPSPFLEPNCHPTDPPRLDIQRLEPGQRLRWVR